MSDIQVTLPDGSERSLPAGSTVYDLATAIGPRLAKAAMASVINEEVRDLRFQLKDGDKVRILTVKDAESVEVLRHSTAHILAQAVQNLYKGAKVAIGPTIENGFYYDFDIPEHQLKPDDLPKIEKEMEKIVSSGQVFQRRNIESVDETVKAFQSDGEIYKAELLSGFDPNDEHTQYACIDPSSQKEVWSDLCRGPHLPDTTWIKAFKLLSVAGAYWRGDENNTQLQRVYATAFWSQKELDEHLNRLEEAKKRDHRVLAKQLELFSIEDEIGPGLILWHPNLAVVREELEIYARQKLRRCGYHMVYTPHLAKRDLWDISGHTNFYMENMFSMDIEGQEYILKPMNCPMHVMIFKSKIRSYRELPLRIAEMGTVYRYEKSGVMHGLSRVRGFTQDDAHLFCRPDQIKQEIKDVIAFVDDTLKMFDMSFEVELSTRPEKFVGEKEIWDQAETALKKALQEYGKEYTVNEGDGAFYGPKIDFQLKDAIGRTWQCSTVQLDFNLPERFELKYTDSDGQAKQPIMIHRAIFGSMERFAGTLIEHYSGAFPTWMAPVQARILPIADRHIEQAEAIQQTLIDNDIRVEIDQSNETFGSKIRQAQLDKIPYMLVLGDKEIENNQVAVRSRSRGDLGAVDFEKFLGEFLNEIKSRGEQEALVLANA